MSWELRGAVHPEPDGQEPSGFPASAGRSVLV
jgi:hypothetical protein